MSVHKKNDQLDTENYRPQVCRPPLTKTLKSFLLIKSQLSDYLTAYRKRHSCKTALLTLTENWKNALDDGERVGLLSTDMSKALDCLKNHLLLGILEGYSLKQAV